MGVVEFAVCRLPFAVLCSAIAIVIVSLFLFVIMSQGVGSGSRYFSCRLSLVVYVCICRSGPRIGSVWLCLVCAACGRGDNSDDVDEKLLIDAVAQTSCLSLGAQLERGGGQRVSGICGPYRIEVLKFGANKRQSPKSSFCTRVWVQHLRGSAESFVY